MGPYFGRAICDWLTALFEFRLLSDAQQICSQLPVTPLRGPQIQRNCCQLVDHRNRVTILREVDCLDVMAATITTFDSNVVILARDVDGEFVDVFLAACRTL